MNNAKTSPAIKPFLLASALCAGLFATSSWAGNHQGNQYRHASYDGHYSYINDGHHRGKQRTAKAKVTRVDPIYQTVSRDIPERSCWTETHYEHRDSGYQSYTPAILGTVIGGAIGNAVGHSNTNKKVGTVVGGVLGATVGRDLGNRNRDRSYSSRPVNQEVCEVNYRTEYEERIVGYDVTYRYRGESYHTRTHQHPGKHIDVAVNVRPLRY